MPISDAVGVTITGMPIYPAFNNVNSLAWLECEVDGCNAHVGKGYEYIFSKTLKQ